MSSATTQPPDHRSRIQALRGSLNQRQLEALLVNHLHTIRYLTGFTGTTAYLLVDRDAAILFVDPRYTEQARAQTRAVTVRETGRDVLKGVLDVLGASDVASCGVEADWLSLAHHSRIEAALTTVTLTPVQNLGEALRARKDATELAALKRAVEISDAAYADLVTWLRAGMTEREVAARLEFFQRSAGGDRKPSETVVASGPRTARPHGIATSRVVSTGEAVMIDIGAVVDGYTSDLTRTVHLGEPPAEFVKIYDVVLEAMRVAIEGLQPGMRGCDVDALARHHIDRSGYGDRFVHALGHSVGLAIHERPNFSPYEDARIEPGMVITVEPGIYLSGRFGVRTEDIVLITDSGCEVLTTSPRELQIL